MGGAANTFDDDITKCTDRSKAEALSVDPVLHSVLIGQWRSQGEMNVRCKPKTPALDCMVMGIATLAPSLDPKPFLRGQKGLGSRLFSSMLSIMLFSVHVDL